MIYQNFDLEIIRPHGGDRLYARVLDSPQGDCPFVDVKWPFDAEQENKALSQIYGDLRQRRGRSSQANTIEDFGGKLFDSVFCGDIEHLFRSSLDSSYRAGQGLRVRLRLPEDSELNSRPWEFLFDTESREFLAVREHTPLVRYLPVAQPIPPITVEGPLRVLVALSSPSDHPRLDTTREWEILRDALDAPIAAGQLELRRVSGRCTFDNLRDSLRHFNAHIFHFVGHGIPGALVLEQESGKGLEMEATHLRAAFRMGALPRLIVLNACSGAITEDVPFSGLAQGFLRQGVPAVVAMQASITDDAALIFTRYFYRDLVEIGAVDTSLTEARLRMQANGHPIEWGTPVLYMRAMNGQLFQPAADPVPNQDSQNKPAPTPVHADKPASHVETMLHQQQKARVKQGTPPPSPSPAPAARKKPKSVREKENPPSLAPRPGREPGSQHGQAKAENSFKPPLKAEAEPERKPEREPATPAPAPVQGPAPEVPAGPAIMPILPEPQPAAQDTTPKIHVAGSMPEPPAPEAAADKHWTPPKPGPVLDPLVIHPITPEVVPAFSLEPEPAPEPETEPSRPIPAPDSATPQHPPAAQHRASAQPAYAGRTRNHVMAAGGLVVVLAVAIGVNRHALFPPAPSPPAETTAARTAEAAPGKSAGAANATTSTTAPAPSGTRDTVRPPAPIDTATPPPAVQGDATRAIASASRQADKPAAHVRPEASATGPAAASARIARKERQAPRRSAAAAPADNCNNPEVRDRSVECVLRNQPPSEAANEIPSGD